MLTLGQNSGLGRLGAMDWLSKGGVCPGTVYRDPWWWRGYEERLEREGHWLGR